MKIFRYPADRPVVAIVLAFFALDLVVYYFAHAPWMVIAWFFIGIFHKACICSFNHHHQHVPTFHQPILNRLLEIPYGFLTGITGHAWFLHHVVGHHRHYKDQEKDESAWKREDGSTMGEVEYAFKIAATGYPRAATARNGKFAHRVQFATMVVIQLILLTGLFWYNWLNALFVFLLPMALSLFITAWHTYFHHAGLDTQDDYEASHNIVHKWYNILTGNLGYHTAHHIRGGMHWSKLPEFHKTIAEKIPERLYHAPCIPFRWMPSK